MIVYAVVDDVLAPDFPLGIEFEVFILARMRSGSSRRCEVAAELRIEERELEAGGLN